RLPSMSLDFESQWFGGFAWQDCFDVCLILLRPRSTLDRRGPFKFQEISHSAGTRSFPMVFEPWSLNATGLAGRGGAGGSGGDATAGGAAASGAAAGGEAPVTLSFANCQILADASADVPDIPIQPPPRG